MTLMMGDLYAALLSAGASETAARAAAEEAALYHLKRIQGGAACRFDLSMWILIVLLLLNIVAVVGLSLLLWMPARH